MLLISHFLDKHSIMVYSWTIKMSSNGQKRNHKHKHPVKLWVFVIHYFNFVAGMLQHISYLGARI